MKHHHNSSIIYHEIILFIVMFLVGISLNGMNILAYKLSHLYLSKTLIYSGLLMASNMTWAHQIVSYLSHGKINLFVFWIGILLSLCFAYILRNQYYINEKDWLKRMISHHSTALTTSKKLLKNQKQLEESNLTYELAKTIIYQQEKEIELMKLLI